MQFPWSRRPQITETAPPVTPPPAGFVYGIPDGGTTLYNQGGSTATGTDRAARLDQLWQAYLACPWASACVDTVARTIVAGGVDVVFDADTDDPDVEIPDPPPGVLKLRALFDYVNPTEDIRQLMRGIISDLQIFGDSFTEIVWAAGEPVALYSLDVPSMRILADQHGTVTGYTQVTETGKHADFTPDEVIHISLDTPRSGLTGVSPTEKALLPITVWLFTAGTLKEVMRKGDPPNIHADFPDTMTDDDIKIWRQKYGVQNTGARNIGAPITTRGGATLHELKQYAIQNYLQTKSQARDEILSEYGVPPAQVGVIESGNLGGGTGSSQFKTFQVNTCGPIAAIVMEKFTFHLLRQAFGVEDLWVVRFGRVDWRDDKVIDDISSSRVRDGRWTLNRARTEIGEPPVEGGDNAVIIDRTNLVLWSDLQAFSKAAVDRYEQSAIAAGVVAPAAGAETAPPGGVEEFRAAYRAALRKAQETV